MNGPGGGGSRRSRLTRAAAAIGLAVGLQLLVLTLLFPNLWYGIHDISDIPIYRDYSALMTQGFQPYKDFAVEYPPLALPLFRLGGDGLDPTAYTTGFSVAMGVLTVAGAALVTLTALIAVAARAAAVRGRRPLRGRRGLHRRHHRQSLRRGRRPARSPGFCSVSRAAG